MHHPVGLTDLADLIYLTVIKCILGPVYLNGLIYLTGPMYFNGSGGWLVLRGGGVKGIHGY